MKLERGDKISILLAALSERYNAQHLIRGRVENIGIWVIGLALGAGGWLLQSTATLSCVDRAALIVGELLALAVLRFSYLADLRKGFMAQQRTAARIEKVLGLYEVESFDNQNESIYPASWYDAGKERSDGKYFRSTFLLIYLAAIFLTAAILLSGSI